MYQQLVSPNLDPYVYQNGQLLLDWYGWCLATVQAAFGTGWAGSTAWDGWTNHVAFQHADRYFPVGVYFPVWFSGYGGYGHVAICYIDPGSGATTIWTSPWKHVPNFMTYSSIDALAAGYGITFAGWSEDIGGTRVIAPTATPSNTPQGGDDVAIIENADNWKGRAERSFVAIRGRDIGPGEFDPWVGQDFLHLIEALEDNPETDQHISDANLGKDARTQDWQGQLQKYADTVTQLQAAVDAANSDDTKTKGQLQAALASVTDLTNQLGDLKAHPVTVYTHDVQLDQNVSTILKVVNSIKGLVLNLFRKK